MTKLYNSLIENYWSYRIIPNSNKPAPKSAICSECNDRKEYQLHQNGTSKTMGVFIVMISKEPLYKYYMALIDRSTEGGFDNDKSHKPLA